MKKISNLFLLIAFAVVLYAFPVVQSNPYYVHLVETIIIYALLLYGLDIVVGYTGQVSLGHAGLFGVGSYVVGVLFSKLGAPFIVTVPLSIIITAGFGGLLAIPALRVIGPYLAMVTLAFGTILQILINEMDFLTAGPLGIKIPKPDILGWQLNEHTYFWVVVTLMLFGLVVIHRVVKSHLGRAFEALRDSPIACDCMGVSVYKYKVYAFVISAGYAGLAGALYAYSEQYISPNTYNYELTVLFLLAIIMGGRKSHVGAVVGASIVVLLPTLLDDIGLFRIIAITLALITGLCAVWTIKQKTQPLRKMIVPVIGTLAFAIFAHTIDAVTDWRLSIFGLMILFVVYYLSDGIVGFTKVAMDALFPRKTQSESVHSEGGASVPAIQKIGSNNLDALLNCSNVVMSFGGLKALNDVSLSVKPGTIHGLIGPNGSGKSTMINVLTGIYKPTSGEVAFDGQTLVGKTSSQIALSGVARTFQNVQLFGEMTLLENILVGLHHTYNSNFVDVALHLPRFVREEKAARERAYSLLKFVGLDALADTQARNLPYGKQRLLEIARALALNPNLLLLDEPAAGLTAPDIKELKEIITKINKEGVTLILIEHHMDVVMTVCHKVSVLDFGQKIAEGLPQEIRENPKVIEAYLGGSAA